MNNKTLHDVIEAHILLDPPDHKGWQPVLCPVCGDRGHKGKRAGFKFDGDSVLYNCFNCGDGQTGYNPHEHTNISNQLKTVLLAFGIPEEEWQEVTFESFVNKLKNNHVKTTPRSQSTKIQNPKVLEIPETFYLLESADSTDIWATIANEHLIYDREINPSDYPFMLSNKTTIPHLRKWYGRLIVPMYKQNQLIFYTGRDLTDKQLKKYESPAIPKSCILGGFDHLFEYDNPHPLYIVEGWFDSYVINGVAILGNRFTKEQIAWLNRSPRTKVYIPDKFGNGIGAAEQALEQGWGVSTPDIGESSKDMSDAVRKYGKLFVLRTLQEMTTYDRFTAETRLGFYCELQGKNKTKNKEPYNPKGRPS